jgi:hypothetical protein
MGYLRTLLLWNASATHPFFLALVLCIMAGLTIALVLRPGLYLPLLLFTSPLPKLFTIGSYTIESAALTAAPGFSVVDMVLAAGILALAFRRWRTQAAPESRAFGRAMVLWSCSVLLSVFIGILVWSEIYRIIYLAYAIRYILTLASFGVAAQFVGRCDESSLRKLLRGLALAGNTTILLGLVYYFEFGSAAGGARGINLFMSADASAALARSYFWFFDYGNDMGYFASLVGVLNAILLSDRRNSALGVLNAAGLLGCVTTCLLIGERADLLVMAVAFGYFIWETSKLRHRSVRVSAVFQVACVAAIVVACAVTFSVIAPEFINRKLQGSVGLNANLDDSAALMASVGVPEGIVSTVISLPIGDFAGRLSLNVAGLWYFSRHVEGVGFWGQLEAAGFYSHHEFVTIAIEQGVPGIAALAFLLVRLKRLLWSGRNLPGSAGQLNVLLRAISLGLFTAMVMANTVLLDMKFMLVYWTLVGVWSVVPREPGRLNPTITRSNQVPQREIASARI